MEDFREYIVYPVPATIENTVIILEQMRKCVCKIEYKNGKATGFFCYIPCQNQKIPVMITNNHIINEETIKGSNYIRVYLNDDKEKKNIDINVNRKIYTNVKYDTTIIEIKPEKDRIYNFLELDTYILFNDDITLFNESIYTLQYHKIGKEQKSSVSYGIIKQIEEYYNINYYCYTGPGSAGSPILNLVNNRLVGIHRGNNNLYNKGTLLKYPINEYINNFNLIDKKTENKNKVNKSKSKNKINNKKKNEIYMLLKIEKEDINKNIYFLDNSTNHNNLKELKESNVDLFINNIKCKFKKYFNFEKEGIYYIKLKFKVSIKDCSYMFYKSNIIKNIDLSCFDSKNVTNMRYMCCDCNNLEYIDLSGFNTEKVTDMSLMFYECHNLLSIDLSSFEIKDTDIHWMFLNCNSLKTVKIKENYYNKIKSQLDGFKHLNIIKV